MASKPIVGFENPRHAEFKARPQPAADETDPVVRDSYVWELRNELKKALKAAQLQVPRRLPSDPEELHEYLHRAYFKLAGVPPGAHLMECAVNNAPALRPGPCDCGAAERLRAQG